MLKAIRGFFRKSLLVLNIVALFFLLIASLSGFFSPEIFLLPSFLIIGFLPLFALQFIFLLVWLLRLKWYFIIPLAGLIVGYPIAKLQVQFNTNSAEETENVIHLISH